MSDNSERVTYEQVSSWADNFSDVSQRLGPSFSRSEPREHAIAYLRGLLNPAERKNSWQLAEMTGATTPYRYQHLLGRARWNEDTVRNVLQRYVVDHLGTPEAVVVIDETGFLKKGMPSAGVARQMRYIATVGTGLYSAQTDSAMN